MKNKCIPFLFAGILTASMGAMLPASADFVANPVISRNCPAFCGTNTSPANYGNDEHYFTFWSGKAPDDYLAYDLSGVPEENRKVIDAVWYNPSAYDVVGLYINRNGEPSDYTIEINKADGGIYPEDGWEIVETVTGNTLSSRQHVIDFEGYNWIRIHVTGVDEKTEGNCSFNFDVHDVSNGVNDSWIFLGDSITNGGMNNCFGTGFATHINTIDNKYFPIQENGGIGGITSTDGKNHIDEWLSTCHAKYVSIAYGTNDAWGNPSNTQTYYENLVYMIQAVLNAGKVPIIPKIPFSTNPDVGNNVPYYNAMIDKIYEEFPEVVKGVDFYAFFEEHPDYLSSDGVHPNDTGYAEMRKIWAETMYQTIYSADSPSAENVKGDLNHDGKCNVSDIIALQKYLMKKGTLKNSKKADLYQDNVINIIDLAVLKQMVLSK